MSRQIVQVPCATLVIAAIGAVSVWSGWAILIASLGSAAFLQILTPEVASARPWPMGAGQAIGVAAGLLAVYATHARSAAPFLHDHPLAWERVLAVAIAMALCAGLQLALKAANAAGATLALLLALGSEPPTWEGAARLIAGVALVGLLGEACRTAILRLPKTSPPAAPSPAGQVPVQGAAASRNLSSTAR